MTHMTGDRDVFQTVGMRQELLWILVKTWRRSHREDGISSTAKKKKKKITDDKPICALNAFKFLRPWLYAEEKKKQKNKKHTVEIIYFLDLEISG